MEKKTEYVVVRVDKSLKRKLDQFAICKRCALSKVIRMILAEALEKEGLKKVTNE